MTALDPEIGDDPRYGAVRAKVRRLRGFYRHTLAYVGGNTAFLIADLATTPDTIWFHWPMLGWGIALVIHASDAYGWRESFGPAWEAKTVSRLMARGDKPMAPVKPEDAAAPPKADG